MSQNNNKLNLEKELEKLEEIKNRAIASKSECEGNILTDCMSEGLEKMSKLFEERDVEYTVIGGLATQLILYDVHGESMVEREFGFRSTNDVDLLVPDRNDALQAIREENYYSGGNPDLDIIQDGPIPGYKDIVDNSDEIEFQDSTIYIPSSEDLVYTKVADPNLLSKDSNGKYGIEKKPGTFYDLQVMSDTGLFEISEAKLRDRISSLGVRDQDSYEVLRRAGFEI